MTQENIEETIVTKEEEILSPEEVKTLDGKTDEELTEVEKKNKKLYAYAQSEKKAKLALKEEKANLEARIKELESQGKDTEEIKKEKESVENKLDNADPIEFAKKVRMLSALDDEEISYAQILAKGMDTTVDKVLETDDFKLWDISHKEKLEEDNSKLNPSNKSVRTEKEDEMFKKFSANLPKGYEIK